jgi:hypothetical protein
MEILLTFEGSRRVLKILEGSAILIDIEREVAKRFPDRDFVIAPIGNKVPQSTSKDVYIVQKFSTKWGYVDVTDVKQIQEGDEVALTKIPKLKVRLLLFFCLQN